MADLANQESSISALDMYWVSNHPELMHIPARVVSREEKTIKVETIEGSMIFELDIESPSVHPSVHNGSGNLLDLGEFNEGALLHSIRLRFKKKLIYTCIGSPILISVNPYMHLRDVFTTKVAK